MGTDKALIGAYTKMDSYYPGYISVSRDGDTVLLTVRGDPTVRENAVFICAYAHEKGQLGRCTPGDENCNNYCNMAPEKGPMQNHPKPTKQLLCGETVTLSLTAAEFAKVSAIVNGG